MGKLPNVTWLKKNVEILCSAVHLTGNTGTYCIVILHVLHCICIFGNVKFTHVCYICPLHNCMPVFAASIPVPKQKEFQHHRHSPRIPTVEEQQFQPVWQERPDEWQWEVCKRSRASKIRPRCRQWYIINDFKLYTISELDPLMISNHFNLMI